MTCSNTKTNTKTKPWLFKMAVGANNEHFRTEENKLEHLWTNFSNDNYQLIHGKNVIWINAAANEWCTHHSRRTEMKRAIR